MPYSKTFATDMDGFVDIINTSWEENIGVPLPGCLRLEGAFVGAQANDSAPGYTLIAGDKLFVNWRALDATPFSGPICNSPILRVLFQFATQPQVSMEINCPDILSTDTDWLQWTSGALPGTYVGDALTTVQVDAVGDPTLGTIYYVDTITVDTVAPPIAGAGDTGHRVWVYRTSDGGANWSSRGVTT